jgi:hypothetical protein
MEVMPQALSDFLKWNWLSAGLGIYLQVYSAQLLLGLDYLAQMKVVHRYVCIQTEACGSQGSQSHRTYLQYLINTISSMLIKYSI